MDFKSYQNKINKLLSLTSSSELDNRLLVIPANNMIANIIDRMSEGLDTNLQKIGEYSKKPSYASRNSFVNKGNFRPKLGEYATAVPPHVNKFKPVNERTSVPLKEGYFEMRAKEGYQNNYVDLMRTNNAVRNITTDQDKDNEVLIGFTDRKEAVKIRGYEERNNKKVVSPSNREIDAFKKEQQKEMTIIIKEIFSIN